MYWFKERKLLNKEKSISEREAELIEKELELEDRQLSIYKNQLALELNEKIQKDRFNNIIQTAQNIINQSTQYEGQHPIFLLIKELIDFELSCNILSLVSTHNSNSVKHYSGYDLLPKCFNDDNFTYNKLDYLYLNEMGEKVDRNKFLEMCKLKSEVRKVLLGFDPVITEPWNISRFISAISTIGNGKKYGEWRQDSNHKAILWLPMGVTIVDNGNHSITTGILNREGHIEVDFIYDISSIYDHIYCDGLNYYRKDSGSLCAPVNNFIFSAIFEIGRCIVDNSAEKKINFNNNSTSVGVKM